VAGSVAAVVTIAAVDSAVAVANAAAAAIAKPHRHVPQRGRGGLSNSKA
jgi:hypothetical protein